MSERGIISRRLLEDIADAIREKEPDAPGSMTPEEMAQVIRESGIIYSLDDICSTIVLKSEAVTVQAQEIRELAFEGACALDKDAPRTFDFDAPACEGIGISAFDSSYIKTFSGNSCLVVCSGAFAGCSSLWRVNLPSVRVIDERCFSGCTDLIDVVIGPDIRTIGSRAFEGCSALESLTVSGSDLTLAVRAFAGSSIPVVYAGAQVIKEGAFESVPVVHLTEPPVSISNMAFSDTTTDIYCYWAEGEVAGAPWGATGATIHYDCN